MSEKGMEILCKRGLLGNLKMDALQFCEHYVYKKQHILKFLKGVHTTKVTLDLIHADCWGPLKVPSLGFKTPVEVWSDQPGDYSILKVFGCPAYYHLSEGKLELRAKKGIFVGYG